MGSADLAVRTPMSPELDDLTQQLTAAMHEGVERARLIHKALGVPMVVWRDGRVQWVDADTLEPVAPPADERKIPDA